MALKGAELARSIAVGMLLKQQREKRFGLQCRVALEVLLDPGPVGNKRIRAGAVVTGVAERTWELGAAQILASSRDAHASTSGGLFLGFAFTAFVQHASDLVVGFHDALLLGVMVPARSTSVAEDNRKF